MPKRKPRAASAKPKPKIKRQRRLSTSSKRSVSKDNHSMDNNTNLNWDTGEQQGKKRRKEGEGPTTTIDYNQTILIQPNETEAEADSIAVAEIPVKQFLNKSQFFIEQLQGEYCQAAPDGWMKVSEEVGPESAEEGSKEATAEEDSPKDKAIEQKHEKKPMNKWTSEEHLRFLEGLREHGKDWPKVQQKVGTRDVKNIISHGQKFLLKLVKFLGNEQTKALSEMTIDEAEFFYGILSKRNYRHTLEFQQRQKEIEELRAKGFPFYVHRPRRKDQGASGVAQLAEKLEEVALEKQEDDGLSIYSKWKKQNWEVTSHKLSLGCSVKVKEEPADAPGRCFFSFKADFIGFDGDADDDDSAASQSSKHLRRFLVDDMPCTKYQVSEEIYQKFANKFYDAFCALPDLDESLVGNEIDVIVHLPNGIEFQFISNIPGAVLSSISNQDPKWEAAMEARPIFTKNLHQTFYKAMEEAAEQDSSDPVGSYHPYSTLAVLEPEQIEYILNSPLTMRYELKSEFLKQQAETCSTAASFS